MLSSSTSSFSGENLVAYHLPRPSMIDRKWKPSVELAPNCPRCDSSNTKFCYYNNYSLTQPRYFCKGCRRYWTKGGSLRNVPVGGGCRKNRRGKLIRQAVADQSCARQSSTSSRHGSIRPDLMLDDPMGSGSQASMSSVDAPTSDGSGIDLADLYAKFSNKTSESGPTTAPAGCPLHAENIEFSGATSHDLQSSVANVDCSMLSLPGGGIPSGDVLPLTDPDFDMNPITWSSQLLLDEAVSNDLLWSSCPTMVSSSTWQPQPLQNNGFAPVPDVPSLLDTNLLNNNNWNMFDSATFEAQFF